MKRVLGSLAMLACLTMNCWSADDELEVLRKLNAPLRRFVLDNGMRCLVKRDPAAPVVAVEIWIGTGSIHEGNYLGGGLSHYVEHMIFKGTETRTAGDVTKEINDAGGNINAYTAKDRTVIHTVMPSRNWKVGISVLTDAVMNSTFPKGEWESEKKVILREIAMGKDSPQRVLSKLLWRTAFVEHPYRFPIIGYKEVFEKMDRNALLAHFHSKYVPDNMITVVVGDIDPDEVEAELRKIFKDFEREPRAAVALPVEPLQQSPRFARETGPYKVMRLEIGYHTGSIGHEDAPALDVLAMLAGQGRSARMVQEIQEKKRLVHSMSAWSYTPREVGLFGVSAVLDADREADVLSAIEEQVQSWMKKSFSDAELAKAKRRVLVAELSALKTMRGQAGNYASGEYFSADPLYSETYLEQIGAVTQGDLMRVARKYLQPSNRTTAILSPARDKVAMASEAPIKAGAIEKSTVTDGLRLLTREDNKLPFVNICVVYKGGLLAEKESNNGVTLLMADLLTRGTKTRTSAQIAEQVEALGAGISGFSGKNSFGVSGYCLARDVDTIMEIMADCLLNSTFPESELEKQKAIQLASIKKQYESPFFVASEQLRKALFPDHPYRWTLAGTLSSVKGLKRGDLVKYRDRLAVSKNCVVSVFGNITKRRASELVDKHLKALPEGKAVQLKIDKPKPELPVRLEQREPKQQAIILLGYPGVDVFDKRDDRLSILSSIMSGLSSDLMVEIRDKRGLAYYGGAYQSSGLEPGAFVMYVGTEEKAVPAVEKLLRKEIKRILGGKLREAEVERAKSEIIGSFERSMQDNAGLAMNCAISELYGLGYKFYFGTDKRIAAITLEQVQDAAASVILEDSEVVSVVLPEKE